MTRFRTLRRLFTNDNAKAAPARRRRAVLDHGELEPRQLLATDVILDFNGGALAANAGYSTPGGNDPQFLGTFRGWSGFPSSTPGVPANREEAIYQIVAAVRDDFAPFDVRVIWDDAGVNSVHYDGQDTVVMIVDNDPPFFGLYGIASSVDINQTNGRDTSLVYGPSHVDPPLTLTSNGYSRFREMIDTISHEIGHTFGLSHSNEADAQGRQLTTIATQNRNFDSRPSSQRLNHAGPETGVVYSEVERLNATVGAKGDPGDAITGQTLPQETERGRINFSPEVQMQGRVDFLGDRDAYQFTATVSGRFGIRQVADEANSSGLFPRVTLWTENGDFLAGPNTQEETFSQVEFDLVAGTTYWVVAGSAIDTETGPVAEDSTTEGEYIITIGAPTFPNRAPVIGAVAKQVTTEGSMLTFDIPANDPNSSDILTYSLAPGAPQGLTINPVTGTVTWLPTDGPFDATVTVIVTDNNSRNPLSASITVQLSVLNVAPSIAIEGDGSSVFELATGLNRTLNIIEPGSEAVTAIVDFGDGAGPINLGALPGLALNLIRPYPQFGSFTITVTVSDKDGGQNTQSFIVTAVPTTDTQTNLVITRERFAVNRGLSSLQIAVDPNAVPAPGPNGIVELQDNEGTTQVAPVINGRGTALLTFKRNSSREVSAVYNSRGAGYKTSKSAKVKLGLLKPRAKKLQSASLAGSQSAFLRRD